MIDFLIKKNKQIIIVVSIIQNSGNWAKNRFIKVFDLARVWIIEEKTEIIKILMIDENIYYIHIYWLIYFSYIIYYRYILQT